MSDRLRLVVMGDSFVGKSSIIKRFLFGTFQTKYVATVEDLFSRDFELAGTALNVDILDTAGDAQFPAMRRLSISSAHAFLLVYSVTDPTSFGAVKQHMEEIKEQRKDFQDIPIVIAGNKIDLVREVDTEEVMQWVEADLPRERTTVIECSASESKEISEIFKSFLRLSKINFAPKCGFKDDGAVGLRRNLSAYGRLKSPVMPTKSQHNNAVSGTARKSTEAASCSGNCSPSTPKTERKFLGLSLSPFGSPASSKTAEDVKGGFAQGGRNSKRSRSLIRRSSKKVKQQVNNVHNPEDCVVS